MPCVTVLASGGLDSTACLLYYRSQRHSVRALWVDYGQAATVPERAAVEWVTARYGIPLRAVELRGIAWPHVRNNSGLLEYRGRNLTLAALAVNAAPLEPGLVALGIHQGTAFADCSPAFVDGLDQLLVVISDGLLRLDCPFLHWTKLEIAQYAMAQGLPLELTYSCAIGTPNGCEECEKCQDKLAIMRAMQMHSAKTGDEQSAKD